MNRLKPAIIATMIAAILLATAASAAAYLKTPVEARVETGAVRSVGPEGRLKIGGRRNKPLVLTVAPDAVVTKNQAPTVLGSVIPGDVVKVEYWPRPGGRSTVVRVDAISLVIAGKITDIDENRSRLTILDIASHTVEIQPQTIVLLNGSLASAADLRPGHMVRAEFDDQDHAKLMRLKIDN